MQKAALLQHIEPHQDCPILTGDARSQFSTAARSANDFSLAVYSFLQKRDRKEQAAWLKTSIGISREIFQPWTMEILYVLAVLGRVRFTELLELLGLSSRTLSDKLKSLRAAGLAQRELFDEQPVRIEYFLTKHGRKTAALASPLFAHLNMEALRQAGKI